MIIPQHTEYNSSILVTYYRINAIVLGKASYIHSLFSLSEIKRRYAPVIKLTIKALSNDHVHHPAAAPHPA